MDNHKVNVENTKITTENISISVSQLKIKQKELGRLSCLSNILSPPTGQKVGGEKKFFARSARKIAPPLSKPWRRPWGRDVGGHIKLYTVVQKKPANFGGL